MALPAATFTLWGPAPIGSGEPSAWLFGSSDRIVLSASLATSTGPLGKFGGGAATSPG
jgi:hypothetical protein